MEQEQLDAKKNEMIRMLKGQPLSVTGSGGDQVSVTMNSRFEVTEVRLRAIGLSHADIAALEREIAKAVNGAVEALAKAMAERLAKGDTDPPSGPSAGESS
jgi:DNA-binding protein YbaB